MKKWLSSLLVSLLVIPSFVQSAEISSPDDFFPANSLITAEFHFTEKFSNFFHELLEQFALSQGASSEEEREAMVKFFEAALKDKTISVSFSPPDTFLLAVQVSEEMTHVLSQGQIVEEYEGIEIYGSGPFFAVIGEYSVIGLSLDAIKQAVDLASGKSSDSLASDAEYQSFVKSYVTPTLLNFTTNLAAMLLYTSEMQKELSEQFNESDQEALEWASIFMKRYGMSVAERSYGYAFQLKVQGDKEGMKEQGISFNPGGNFTPNLYKQFPNAKPMYYAEGYNVKAQYDLLKKYMEFHAEEDVSLDTIGDEIGFDFERVANVFDQELALAIQVPESGVIPYVTLMANVENNRESAQELLDELVSLIESADLPPNMLTLNRMDGFTTITVNPMVLSPEASAIGPIEFTLGIDEEGLLILSNHPGIQDSNVRTGFASDIYFSQHVSSITSGMGISYINARYFWNWLDSALAWGENTSGEVLDLEFYRNYYFLLEKIYPFRDIFMVEEATDNEQIINGKVVIDSAKHKNFKTFVKELKSSDADGDGVSDYDERYVYFTPQDVADSDGDGISDFEEFKKGSNPRGEGKLFSDVPEGQYYSDAVGILYQQGTVKGYSDGTFQPGKAVNRAEFVSMVMNGLESPSGGLEIDDYSFDTFSDVNYRDWYFSAVAEAYSAGVVRGNTDSSGQRFFRPGDPITRAEALTILYRASQSRAFQASSTPTSCSAVFEDVQTSDWFCDAVARGYENGITTGKEPKAFKPLDHITRAEAAVLIQRTLSRERTLFEAETPSFEDIFEEGFESIGTSLPDVI